MIVLAFAMLDLFLKRFPIFRIWGAPGRRFGRLVCLCGISFGVLGLHFGSFWVSWSLLVPSGDAGIGVSGSWVSWSPLVPSGEAGRSVSRSKKLVRWTPLDLPI